MSYKTYTTDAIVCGSRPSNTADKAFLLFTRDAGMLWASARSVREERSKQRYALQDFAHIKVSLVKGKSGWRIGSAECQHNYFAKSTSRNERASITAVIRLLRRFLHGEENHPRVFEDTLAALRSPTEAVVEIFSLRLLHRLGYIAATPDLSDYLTAAAWGQLPSLPERARDAIKKAQEVSHL